ncbi:FimV/HubP family polar landmark protein, partial [Alteromonas sp. KUL150]|uniref:FimV/HubP family polar landmark protein n=3 Tax=unclassified Alteromonas TaxID=2614992 RepID=UPI0027E41DC7
MKLHLTGLLLLTLCLSCPVTTVDAQERATFLKGPKDATDQFSGLEYGPIDANDTLWRIAERYRQNNNLSVYQVMTAIYELNPNAFENGNLNLLVDGAVLKLPSERYIARIDKQKAQMRAEQDERAFAEMLNKPGSSVRNIKPASPLVNQQDLTQTQTDIEQKITRLDQEQNRQFDELRMQFAASLENVEAILNENRRLYERVEAVNGELETLRGQVEGDVKAQLDMQVALQQELLDMIKAEQAQREAEKQSSFLTTLTSPLSLIIGSAFLSLLLVGGLIMWLLKRNSKPEEAPSAGPTITANDDDIPVPDADIGDLSSALAPDLDEKAELSDDDLFNDDDLLDDVLTSDLEESLDDELESFADLEDDMLVPDNDDDLFEAGDDELDQSELDSLFDDDDLSDKVLNENDADDLEGFDLSGDDDVFEESGDSDSEQASDSASAENAGDDDDFDIDDLLDNVQSQGTDEESKAEIDESEEINPDDILNEVNGTSESENVDEDDIDALLASSVEELTDDAEPNEISPSLPTIEDEDEKPEISIDDLLEEHGVDAGLTDELDSNDELINEDMLSKLDDEINQQNKEIDKITDDLLNEIEQIEMMGGLGEEEDDDDDFEDEITTSAPSPQSIQSLDAITDDLDDLLEEEIEVDSDFSDPLSDELIAELQSEQENDDSDFEDDDTSPESVAEPDDDEDFDDPFTDELLAELEAELEGEPVVSPEADSLEDTNNDISDGVDEEEEDDFSDPLTDELLAELEAEESKSSSDVEQLTDELLSELEAEIESGDEDLSEPESELGSEMEEPELTSDTEPEVDLGTKIEEEPELEAEVDSLPEPELEFEPEAESEIAAANENELSSEAEIEPETELDVEEVPEVTPEAESESEFGTEAEQEPA